MLCGMSDLRRCKLLGMARGLLRDTRVPRLLAARPPHRGRSSLQRGIAILAMVLTSGTLHADDPAEAGTKDAVTLYNTNCAGCHGKDGRARTPMAKKLKVRDLSKSKIPDVEVERQIRKGRQGPKGETLMPSFDGRLSDDDIKRLIAKVKEFRV